MSQLAGLARQQPVLMIFEDVHWVDPTSLEVVSRTVDRIKTLQALLIVTFRPEFNAPWVGQPHVTSLTLNRLGEREAATIIAGLVGNTGLPRDVMVEIVERTDGIPLFVEEMTKAESEAAARRTVAAVPSSALAVPASLHGSTGSARPRRWRRSARRSGGSSRMHCWPRWHASPRRSWDRRSTVSCRLVCYPGRACRRRRATCSSMPWCRTRPMARCCASRDADFTPLSPKPSKASSPRLPKASPTSCASLHRNRTDREGRGFMGQGGPAVTGALSAGRSRGPAHPRPRPNRDPARHGGAAPRADQASGRADHPTHPHQRLCCRRNQGGCGAGTFADQAS